LVLGSDAVNTVIQKGVANNGTGLKHARVTTGTLVASSNKNVTVSWISAFADASYTPVCTLLDTALAGSGGGLPKGLWVAGITSQTSSSVVVLVINSDGGASHSGTLNCTAMHD